MRSVFERALSSVGLHVTKGLAVWEAYREFENAIVEAARVSELCPPQGGQELPWKSCLRGEGEGPHRSQNDPHWCLRWRAEDKQKQVDFVEEQE